ncbi:hypothetical protein ABZP36_003538 [Zizania latifolia]
MANNKPKRVADWTPPDLGFLSDPRFLHTPEKLIVDFPGYFSILQHVHEQANTRGLRFGDDIIAGEIEEAVVASDDDGASEEAATTDASFSHIVDLIEELLVEEDHNANGASNTPDYEPN